MASEFFIFQLENGKEADPGNLYRSFHVGEFERVGDASSTVFAEENGTKGTTRR